MEVHHYFSQFIYMPDADIEYGGGQGMSCKRYGEGRGWSRQPADAAMRGQYTMVFRSAETCGALSQWR